jgi:DNA-binding response OmpR family regulator
MKASHRVASEGSPIPRVQSAETSVERRTLTALIIDANVQQRDALRTAFVAEGYRVRAVGDGDTGLILAREVDPDLVVLDMDVPHLSGSELTRQIRLGSSVPILVVSSRRAKRDRIHALDLGADDVLVRPFSIGELMARTRAVLRRFAHEQVELMHTGTGPGNLRDRSTNTGLRYRAHDSHLTHS